MKTNTALSFLAISMAAITNTHAAESVEGVLEKGQSYSAIFSASPESGDLIGYAFKNDSTAGKSILKNCFPGLFCKVGKATLRTMNTAPPLKTTPEPAGWVEVTSAHNPAMETTVFGYEQTAKSRYGVLSVREIDNVLLFKGKPVQPKIEGNSGLSVVANYQLGKNDVFLLQNSGGTACPALYTFVTIDATGIRTTPEFGTCSDIIYPTSDSKDSVTVMMAGVSASASSQKVDKTTAQKTTAYKYLRSEVFENGKPLR